MAVDYFSNAELPCEQTMCRSCDRFGVCSPIPNATRYYVDEHGSLPTLDINAMMAEIYQRGVTVLLIRVNVELFETQI